VREQHAWLLGARDLDPLEEEMLLDSPVGRVPAESIDAELADPVQVVESGEVVDASDAAGGGADGGVVPGFGWSGANPGAPRAAMEWEGIGRVSANTTLAACGAGLGAVVFVYPRSKTWDLGMSVNGFLGGLVAITCPCYWVSPAGAIILGGVAGVLVVLGVELLEWLRIDDPIGAVPVHGFCGIWGTVSLGLFACGKYGATGPVAPDNTVPLTGLLYGGGAAVLKAQVIGSSPNAPLPSLTTLPRPCLRLPPPITSPRRSAFTIQTPYVHYSSTFFC